MPPLPSSTSSRSESSSVPISANGGGDCSRGSQLAVAHTAVDVRINDLVGNGISGILQKWVNYGKGWRHRWFVLQDGVLSYYKIHGPDKIVINPETEKGFKVIGDESMRIINRNRNSHHSQNWRKPFGEIHLKVHALTVVLNSFLVLILLLFARGI
jgi:oxysterol-binding protein 1